jgi:spermidine synthase
MFSNMQKIPAPGVLATTDSSYQHIRISEDNQATRYMQFDGSFGAESVYKKTQLATGYYYDYASTLPILLNTTNKKPKQVLILGLAGGTIARQLHALYGNDVSIDAVEIDPLATKLAYQYMGLGNTPITIYHQDGRPFLASGTKQYDFIFVDAYQNELQIPWTFTTVEFWRAVQTRLSPTGIAAMNIAALGTEHSSLVEALANTGAAVFPWVYQTPLWSGRNASHFVLLAKHTPDFSRFNTTKFAEPEFKAASAYLQEHLEKTSYSSRLSTLTDNRSPLEWIMAGDILK